MLCTYRQSGGIRLQKCDRADDARLAERIVYGVLQNERFLDFCISSFLTSGINRLHPKVLEILRLSAYQILFLDRVPDSAVVNDAVKLCRSGKQSYAAGMINAVLRRFSEKKEMLLSSEIRPSIRYSHPDWLVDELSECYENDFITAFLEANQKIPDLRLQVNTKASTYIEFLKLLDQEQIEILDRNDTLSSVLIHSTDVETIPGYKEGLFYIQDDAARVSVYLSGIRPGMEVLDACAAPGGKSIAAALMGARVLSCDVSAKRLERCTENYLRLGLNDIRVQCMDASVFNPSFQEVFEIVIADVPCSGSGVIRKHPEIRKKTYEEVCVLRNKQRDILFNLSRYVKPGGGLIYSTCSVLREENEDQIEAFLAQNDRFCLEAVQFPGYSCQNGMLHSWPQENGCDGFFAAKLRRLV